MLGPVSEEKLAVPSLFFHWTAFGILSGEDTQKKKTPGTVTENGKDKGMSVCKAEEGVF